MAYALMDEIFRHKCIKDISTNHQARLPICLFGVFCHTRDFFTHMETSPLPLKGCKILAHVQHSKPLGFFSEGSIVLLCHWASVYNCHTLHVFTTKVCRD